MHIPTFSLQRQLVPLFCCLALSSTGALAASTPASKAADTPHQTTLPIPKLQSFVTEHKGTFNHKTIKYTATVSNMHLKNAKGEVYADAVTTAYVAKGKTNRPVTFVFNGGPGSASIWLHMGMFGPKVVDIPSDAKDPGNAPYHLIDNPDSPLDKTDLVFIDPIGTGYSKLAGVGKAKDVWGLKEDAKSVSQIVKQWVDQHHRWNSPKYLAGESYGTTRAAAMQPFLDNGSSPMRMNGLILISQALDYTGSTPAANNMIAFVTYLPTMAATAWYHHKISHDISLQDLLKQAETFAVHTYLPALFQGSELPSQQFNAIAAKLAYFTGLPVDIIKRANLRVTATRQTKLLLANKGLSVGRLDARYTTDEIDDLSVSPKYDAASAAISSAYSAAFHTYLHHDLKVNWQRQYQVSSESVNDHWIWDRTLNKKGKEPKYVNSANDLAKEMRKNPHLRVLLASGYFDYATPFFDGEYTFARHGINLDRVTRTYYQSGHMIYLHKPSKHKLAADIREFYTHK